MTFSDEERLARMRGVWSAVQRSAMDAPEVDAAYRRYRHRGEKPATRPLLLEFGLGIAAAASVLLALSVGGVLSPESEPATGLVVVAPTDSLAAVGTAVVAVSGASLPDAPVPGALVPGASGSPVSAYQARIEIAGRTVAIEPFVPYVVVEGETAVVHLGHEVQTIMGPSVLEFRLDADRASGWRMDVRAGEAIRAVSPSSSGSGSKGRATVGTGGVGQAERRDAPLPRAAWDTPPAAPAEQGSSWAEAAEGLRNGDDARAEEALKRLVKSDNAATRDSAELTLAQVRLSQGKAAEARASLRRLSEQGATPFIRRRASELLQSL